MAHSVVTLVLYLTPFQRYCRFPEKSDPTPYSTRILGMFPLEQIDDVVAPRSEDPKLIIRVINFELVQHAHGTIHQCYGRMDRRTDDLR